VVGQDSVVGIATRCGLTSRGSNPAGGEILHAGPYRPRVPPSLLYNGIYQTAWPESYVEIHGYGKILCCNASVFLYPSLFHYYCVLTCKLNIPNRSGNLFIYTCTYGLSASPSSDRVCPKGKGALSQGVSGRGVKLTVLLLVGPELKVRGAIFPLSHASSWRISLLSTNKGTFTFI
jgi:hypothetical protein